MSPEKKARIRIPARTVRRARHPKWKNGCGGLQPPWDFDWIAIGFPKSKFFSFIQFKESWFWESPTAKKKPAGNALSGLKHGDYPISGLKPISAFEPE